MRLSRLLASLGLLAAFPTSFVLAYVGFRAGYYPYPAVPFVLAGIFLLLMVLLFVLIPYLGALEDQINARRHGERDD